MNIVSVVSFLDKVADCIPGVSFITDGCILAYQHKQRQMYIINQTARTILQPERKESDTFTDLKIYFLSKPATFTKRAMVPVLGNLYALVTHVVAFLRSLNLSNFNPWTHEPQGPLECAAKATYEEMFHREEVVSSYLARHPDIAEMEVAKALALASTNRGQYTDAFEIILNSRDKWSATAIDLMIKPPQEYTNPIILQRLLESDKVTLTPEQAKMLFKQIVVDGRTTFIDNAAVKKVLATFNEKYRDCINADVINKCFTAFKEPPKNTDSQNTQMVRNLYDLYPGLVTKQYLIDDFANAMGRWTEMPHLTFLKENVPEAFQTGEGDSTMQKFIIGAFKVKDPYAVQYAIRNNGLGQYMSDSSISMALSQIIHHVGAYDRFTLEKILKILISEHRSNPKYEEHFKKALDQAIQRKTPWMVQVFLGKPNEFHVLDESVLNGLTQQQLKEVCELLKHTPFYQAIKAKIQPQ